MKEKKKRRKIGMDDEEHKPSVKVPNTLMEPRVSLQRCDGIRTQLHHSGSNTPRSQASSIITAPVLMLTATATDGMVDEIIHPLHLLKSKVEIVSVLPNRYMV